MCGGALALHWLRRGRAGRALVEASAAPAEEADATGGDRPTEQHHKPRAAWQTAHGADNAGDNEADDAEHRAMTERAREDSERVKRKIALHEVRQATYRLSRAHTRGFCARRANPHQPAPCSE